MRTKSRLLLVFTALTLASFTTGCFGKFALTRKLYGWNDSMDNKFVKTVIMWAFFIVPVYEVFSLADLFVLNLIEFWGGSNPVSNLQMQHMPDGSVRVERDGIVMRLVPTGENRFDIFRDGALVGTATMTGDRGLVFTAPGSDKVVRVTPEDVKNTEQVAAKLQIAPPPAQRAPSAAQ
jgi:hypothetical protein